MRVFRNTTLLFALILSLSFLFSAFGLSETGGGFCGEEEEKKSNLIEMATLGGIRDSHASSQNSDEIHNLAKFAVDEHNKKENAMIELARVVKAQEQVVAGTLHHLTLEVIDAGKKKLYEAKVWVKPWLNFKELQEFTHVEDVPTLTSSDLGVKQGDIGLSQVCHYIQMLLVLLSRFLLYVPVAWVDYKVNSGLFSVFFLSFFLKKKKYWTAYPG
uniref:Cysteine proteinase inhibitor n=1 Tax=Nicotiana tabacum TaxID=4097 RepID=A0A1S4BYK4_TOBAC|nr:PREDICTED: cysteine proteinase inhibitor 6-like isoform X2 [Nicotiana tabacum]